MFYSFIGLWLVVLALNKFMARQVAGNPKLSNALKAMVLIPMSLMGYLLHPLIIRLVKDQVLISLVMMVALSGFAFVNLWIIGKIRRKGGKG
ncbi:MAG TPA: hypothetical protein PKM27_06925 [Saprospiraceae bacterium]|nr:hypothetical protein [Saprospiraceae bacterium]HNT21842.1 hypothetical protein [Saprospiraceae bacterium]